GVTRHREFLALLAGGLRVVGRRVAAGQDDLALGHVLARAEPEARLAGVELVASLRLLRRRQPLPLRIEPEITVAGVEEPAVALVGFLAPAAVVHEVTLRCPHADVAGTVELRPDLADLGRHQLVVIDERVLPERPAGRRAGNRHRPAARAERRNARMVQLAEG